MKAKRNDPCPCGSGKKYKKCCYEKDVSKKINAKVISSGSSAGAVGGLFQKFGTPQTEATKKEESAEKDCEK